MMKPRHSYQDDPRREAALNALSEIADPLLSLMMAAGVTVRELNSLFRERAVHNAAQRISTEKGRLSKARVAILTGLPRSEVARILALTETSLTIRTGQHPARRVLAAWYDDPKYLTADGEPAVLPIFGKRRTFERLVATHSRGIPVRAMLDELAAIDAIEIISEQRVRAKARLPFLGGLTTSAVSAMGERCRDLLETLTSNARNPSSPLFEATAVINDAEPSVVARLRRDIASQGSDFISGMNSLLSRSRKKPIPPSTKGRPKQRLGVTIYYFQKDEAPANALVQRRKNFRRATAV